MTDLLPPIDDSGIEGLLLRIVRDIGLVFSLPSSEAAGIAAIAQQHSYRQERPSLLTPAEVQEAMRRGLVDDGQYEETLARGGYSDPAINVWRGLLGALLDAGALVALHRRGTIDADEFSARMAALGYDGDAAGKLYSLTEYVPPAQDVIRFAVREIYTPEIAEKFGQFENFPEQAMHDFERAGLPREQALKYWAAHWELPSPEQVIEMIHRDAETGVTVDDLRTLLRAADVMPFWREKFIALATNPFTRVDIRRMHKVGVLKTEELPRAYRDIGYNEDRAKKLADFTVKLNEGDDAEAAKPWRAGIRSRALALHLEGILSPAELTDVLKSIGHSPEEIDFYLAEAAFEVEGRYAQQLRDGVKGLYVSGHWTAGQAVKRLAEAGYEQPGIDALMRQWDLAKELREATALEREQKDLSRADLLGALSDGILGEGEVGKALQDLGYDAHEADVLVQREKAKITAATRKQVEASVRGALLAHKIDYTTARGTLGENDVPAARVDLLIRQWTAEVEANAPTLTLAQVQQALRRKLMTEQEAIDRLTRLGYSERDRTIIIGLAAAGATP